MQKLLKEYAGSHLAPAFINSESQGAFLILLLELVRSTDTKTYRIQVYEDKAPVGDVVRGNVSEVVQLPFCVIASFSHLTQSIHSLSYSSHSPEV